MTSSRPTSIRMVAAAAAGVLGVAGLTGCSWHSSSTAIVAGSHTVSMATFDDVVAHCGGLAQSSTLSARQVIASTLAQGAVGEQILTDTGRTLSTAERDKVISSNDLSVLIKDPVCQSMARSLAAMYWVINTDGQAKTLKEMAAVDVTVNPRLGQWFPRQLAVAGTSSMSSAWTGQ